MTEAALGHSKKPRKVRKPREIQDLPRNTPAYRGTVSDEDLRRGGGKLLGMLMGRADELGHSRHEMANFLGITYGYLAQISCGQRKPENLSADLYDRCAKYLGVSKFTVLMAAGILDPKDTLDNPDEFDTTLHSAVQFIARDPRFGALMPEDLTDPGTSLKLQYFVVRLYEAATGRKLLSEKSMPEIVHGIQEVEQRRLQLVNEFRA